MCPPKPWRMGDDVALIAPSDWQPVGVQDLEPNAWTALRHCGSTSVVAGPGAGKTEFLAQRAAFLLQTGICPAPYRVLAISFKKDAADNLASRVRLRCPAEQAGRFVSLTFDAFTKGLVDRFVGAIPASWRPTYPYDVAFPKRRDVDAFLERTRFSAATQWQGEIISFSALTFEAHQVGGHRLPIQSTRATSGRDFAVQQWWTEHLRHSPRSSLTFVSLNRLAELLLRANPQILRALRTTYPFVFVDEFQDTTYAQYDFLLSAFSGGRTVVTAVGDNKQRIMVWAGARVDAFAKFEAEFRALRVPLIFNFRSSSDLVRIQHVLARALDSDAVETQAQTKRSVNGDVAQIWTFDAERTEAEKVAQWLSADMRQRKKEPRDYAIIVRQTADRFETQLSNSFVSAGLQLRNESKALGRTTLQDLLAEDITRVGIALLRLGVQRRAPTAWITASQAVMRIRTADFEDEVTCQNAEAGLTNVLVRLRAKMVALPDVVTAEQLVDQIFDFLDLKAVACAFPEYGIGDVLAITVEAFRLHLSACASVASTWSECLDSFEGVAQVPLMTVHKSKGLEYDTILFVGLDDKTWWSHTSGNPEGLATLFVGLSRAKQRVIFTFCRSRGGRRGVADLYQLLADAGVPEISF